MKYEVKPIIVEDVSLLALHLYEQTLAQDFDRINKSVSGYKMLKKSVDTDRALAAIRRQMLRCEQARQFLKDNFLDMPEDKTEY